MICVHQEQEDIEKEIAKVKGDLRYIKHFPNSEKYISVLLPLSEESASSIQRIRSDIERKLQEEAIVAEADEGLGLGKHSSAAGANRAEQPDTIPEQDDFFLEGDEEDAGPLPSITMPVSFASEEENSSSADNDDADEDADEDENANGSGTTEKGKSVGGAAFKARADGGARRKSGGRDASHGGLKGSNRNTNKYKEDRHRRNDGHSLQKKTKDRAQPSPAKSKTESEETTPRRTRAEGGRKRRRKR